MSWTYDIGTEYHTHYSYADNATEVYNSLKLHGFSHEAAIGVLANMEHESYINPGQQEHGYGGDESRGYGLVQWTPGTKVINFAKSTGANWYDGVMQMDFFYINVPESWIETKTYPISYDEYKELDNIYTASRTFFYNFERGTYHSDMDKYAAYWDEYFGGVVPPTPPTPPVPPSPWVDDDIMAALMLMKMLK